MGGLEVCVKEACFSKHCGVGAKDYTLKPRQRAQASLFLECRYD